VNEEALAHWGLSRQKQTKKQTRFIKKKVSLNQILTVLRPKQRVEFFERSLHNKRLP
jgi:hypothetical protein